MSQPCLSRETAQILFAHPDALANIPTDPFTLSELGTHDAKALVRRLNDSGAFSTEFITVGDARVIEYEFTSLGLDRREACLNDRFRPLPCNHVGISNIDGSTYECCYGGCDEIFARSEVDL